MTEPHASRSTTGYWLGFGLGIPSGLATKALDDPPGIVWLGVFLAFAIIVWASVEYARAKGQPGWKGIYVIAFPIGLVALTALPDISHERRRKRKKRRPDRERKLEW